jgi:hypothetical protein
MREICSYGSVRGAARKGRPYRNTLAWRGIDARGELSAGFGRLSAGPASSSKRESGRPETGEKWFRSNYRSDPRSMRFVSTEPQRGGLIGEPFSLAMGPMYAVAATTSSYHFLFSRSMLLAM